MEGRPRGESAPAELHEGGATEAPQPAAGGGHARRARRVEASVELEVVEAHAKPLRVEDLHLVPGVARAIRHVPKRRASRPRSGPVAARHVVAARRRILVVAAKCGKADLRIGAGAARSPRLAVRLGADHPVVDRGHDLAAPQLVDGRAQRVALSPLQDDGEAPPFRVYRVLEGGLEVDQVAELGVRGMGRGRDELVLAPPVAPALAPVVTRRSVAASVRLRGLGAHVEETRHDHDLPPPTHGSVDTNRH